MFTPQKMRGVLVCGAAFAVSLSIVIPLQAAPVTLYVATTGHYSTSRAQISNPLTPAGSITNAAQVSQPGDTIEVAPGTYNEDVNIAYESGLLIHPTPGSTTRPIIRPSAGNDFAAVKINGTNDITFTGFEVDGSTGGPNCGGIDILPRTTNGVITPCHNTTIMNCYVHDAGGGIGSNCDSTYTVGNDYNKFIGNIVSNCLHKSIYDGSGMGLHQDEINPKFPNTPGYHSFIENNIIYDNLNLNTDKNSSGFIDPSKHTDGNGIIIDTNKDGPPVLIQNNIVYHNSGRGIHVFYSNNVTVLNNTVYENNQDPYLSGKGELTAGNASNVLFSNNVVQSSVQPTVQNGVTVRKLVPAFRVGIVSGTDPATGKAYANGSIIIKNTTYTVAAQYPNDKASDITETHKAVDTTSTTYSDPAWGSLFVNPTAGDFHLRALATRRGLSSLQSQTALNRGSSVTGEFATDDINGIFRVPAAGNPPGGRVDKGAYEQSGQIAATRGGYRYQRRNGHVFQAITLTAAAGDVEGPISLVLDNLSGASLVNSTGVTSSASPAGSPYINTASTLRSDTSASVVLEFTTYPKSYTTRILFGTQAR